ncbi:MAG: bifunctional 5,10-methylenetetrahydrofolate dehydrogenase/5,10-methenyltetrahydrofolate cyclohydrolase [Acidobacteriota bacterium]
MPARRLDGAALAARLRMELAPRVAAFVAAHGRRPGLDVVLVGRRPESELYVRNKLKAVSEAGCRADLVSLDESAPLAELLATVARLNASSDTDAILVQSPLPTAMGPAAQRRVFDMIDPAKDVDGFHAANVGRLVQKRSTLVACTPLGCAVLLEREGIPLAGKHAVVIGRSDIVGKPMALLLLHRDATVTICHSRTAQLAEVAASADVLIAAIGRPAFVTPEFVKPGATVIDVGINVLTSAADVHRVFPEGSAKRRVFEQKGSVLVGDVHPDVEQVAAALTPVPGGVGPLTIAMVLHNTITAAELRARGGGSDDDR